MTPPTPPNARNSYLKHRNSYIYYDIGRNSYSYLPFFLYWVVLDSSFAAGVVEGSFQGWNNRIVSVDICLSDDPKPPPVSQSAILCIADCDRGLLR